MLRISVVSYSNALPYVYGLHTASSRRDFTVKLDHPADCAKKLLEGSIDVGLVPVAALAFADELTPYTNYCIASDGPVETVKLYSNSKIEEVKRVKLDYQSKTSVALCRILFKEHWKLNPVFEGTEAGYELGLQEGEAMVVIGDRCFDLNGKFNYEYDLSVEWKALTGLPFVFALWAGKKGLATSNIRKLQDALAKGLDSKEEALQHYLPSYKHDLTRNYWRDKIVFELNDKSIQAYKLFIEKVRAL